MYDLINRSIEKAMAIQRWNEGDRFHRIGNPFEWVDANATVGHNLLNEKSAMMPHFCMIYEEYPTPEEICTNDFDEVKARIKDTMIKVFRLYFPYLDEDDYQKYFNATSLTRAQDYGFIASFSDLHPGINHLDIGPGLGSHAFYSRTVLNSTFYALEAYPQTYDVQQKVFRTMEALNRDTYYDLVEAETFGIETIPMSVAEKLNNEGGIIHVPSWKFDNIKESSIDLITATWVLNETNFAGNIWLITHCMNKLKLDGQLYIRDSGILKPNRHKVNYDNLLVDLGFELIHRLDVKNRVDFYGVPRMYRKTKDVGKISFDEMVIKLLGHFDTTSNPFDSISAGN